MKLRLEITIECDDDVRAEDCQAVAAYATTGAQTMLAPHGPVFSRWRLVETKAHGGSFVPEGGPL